MLYSRFILFKGICNYRFVILLWPILFVSIIVYFLIVGTPKSAHADSSSYRHDQVMNRLVTAEEAQARALQRIAKQLETLRK